MNFYSKIKLWCSHVWNIVEHRTEITDALSFARKEYLYGDASIVAGLRAEHEAAVADLKHELQTVKNQFDSEAAHVRSVLDWLEVSKRDAQNYIGSRPQRNA